MSLNRKLIRRKFNSANRYFKKEIKNTLNTATLKVQKFKQRNLNDLMTNESLFDKILDYSGLSAVKQRVVEGINNVKKYIDLKFTPTLEEYKEMKRQEIRNRAAKVNSETITPNFPVLSGGPWKGHDMDVRGKKGWDDEKIIKEFAKYALKTQDYLDKHPDLDPLSKLRMEETLSYYREVVKNPKYIDSHGGGFGCIYTASGAYGDQLRNWNNKALANKIKAGKDTGFIIVDSSQGLKKGDIIQLGKSEEDNYPHHAEMVTDTFLGYPKLALTQAEGYGLNDKENDWNNYLNLLVRSAFDKHGGTLIVRFVGNKRQNKLWELEYKRLYGNKK